MPVLVPIGTGSCTRRATQGEGLQESAATSTSAPAPTPEAVPPAQSAPPQPAAAPTPPPAPVVATPLGPLSTCAGDAMPKPPPPSRANCDAALRTERITILHVSDTHGHFHRYLGGRSPFAILRAYVERRRAETGGKVLFVDAGDDLEKGSIVEARTRGAATLHLLERLGLDVRTLGNHDFAWGEDSVLAQAGTDAHVVLSSNIRTDRPWGARKTAVVDVGCAKIGLLGLLTNPYDETDERFDGDYLEGFSHEHDDGDVDRYVSIATPLVRALRDEAKVDAVVAVNHLGLARDRALVDNVPGLDLVVSGHDHVLVPGAIVGRNGAIVTSGSWLGGPDDARVGETVLEIERGKGVRLVSTTTYRLADLADLDPALDAEVARLAACFAPDADVPVGDLDAPLSPWAVDAWTPLLEAALRARFPEARAFLYDARSAGGILKSPLPRGPITPQQIADATFSERQKVGTAGFTAFQPVEVPLSTLRAACAAPIFEPRIRRLCPPKTDQEGDGSALLVVERRVLHAPKTAFRLVPENWPTIADPAHAVEAADLLTSYATRRAKACLALDRDVAAPCRSASLPLGPSLGGE